jgi:hypothetical protein
MPLISSQPTIFEGNEYPYFGINLSISSLWQPTDVGGSVALRLIPYRTLEDGTIEKLDDQPKSAVYFDVFQEAQNDPALAEIVTTIMGALQQFITDKNL